MCGIAGVLYFNDGVVSNQELRKMTNILEHRGPDGEGSWIHKDKKVGFGHRRLAIIDIDKRSDQPFRFEHLSITFNGEIYNYVELRDELKKLNYSFLTESDTEVLIKAYHAYGSECLKKLDGMFAFAIYDEKNAELFMARDRFGEKPFFYSQDKNQVVFASEIKALAAHFGKIEVNDAAVYRYLVYDVIENANDKSETFFKNIKQLPPAHFLKIRDGRMTLSSYWSIHPQITKEVEENAANEHFREYFFKSVKCRLRSDVEVGTSLSGGLDSSSVMAAIFNGGISEIAAFSARFKDDKLDEGSYIDIMNERYPFKRNDIWPDETGLSNELEKLFYHQEEPFGSSSIYAQWEVMKEAKKRGVKVLLDGQGGDELMAGYFKYFPFALKNHKYDLPRDLNILRRELNVLPSKKALFQAFFPSIFDLIKQSKLIKGERRKIESDLGKSLISNGKTVSNPHNSAQNLNEALYFDTFQYGLGKLLRFADRNSMAHSREIRLPFLSHELVEWLFSLQDDMKIRVPWTKFILRQSMRNFLPEEICWRKDKKGFGPPQATWMKSETMKKQVEYAKKNLIDRGLIVRQKHITEWQVLMVYQLYRFAERNWTK